MALAGPDLRALHRDHQGISRYYYLDVLFEATIRSHVAWPQLPSSGGRR